MAVALLFPQLLVVGPSKSQRIQEDLLDFKGLGIFRRLRSLLGVTHFNYVHFTPNLLRQTGSVLGAALRREYPGLVDENVASGRPPRKRLAFSWSEYYGDKDANGLTAADRVKEEFWSFFTAEELMEELDQNIDNYCQERVPKILCQARVDAVKYYGRAIKGKNPNTIELEFEQYLTCKLDWFSVEAWKAMCHWWTSRKYAELRKRGQDARFANEDYAQQRGGSLPFPTIQENLEYRFGSEKAGGLDTYKVHMGGFNASLKGSGKVPNQKVQKRIVDYIQAMNDEYGEENWQESGELDGGLKHGRFAMENGSFKKAEVLGAVKQKKARFSGSSYQAMQRNSEELQHQVDGLKERDQQREVVIQEQQEMIQQQQEFIKQQQELMKVVFQNIGMSIPSHILASWESEHMRTSGSHTTYPNECEQKDMENA